MEPLVELTGNARGLRVRRANHAVATVDGNPTNTAGTITPVDKTQTNRQRQRAGSSSPAGMTTEIELSIRETIASRGPLRHASLP
jgi:hypothetical protein